MPGACCGMRASLLLAAGMASVSPAAAKDDPRTVPISDTEDAGLDSQSVGAGRLHPVLGLDVRNGDFVRGTYDDDGAGLDRVPVHVQLGLVYELVRDGDTANAWLEVRSSNGFHAPGADETASPRAWYESNNLVGIATRLSSGLTGAITYAIKTSPNGVSDTTHELSGALALEGTSGLAALNPGFAATWRPKGGGGLYTQATIEPGIDLGRADRLSAPAAFGVGWGGFYERGSGTRMFGRVGLAYKHPFRIGEAHLAVRAEASALFRDDRLRQLDAPMASPHTIRPFGTIAVSYAY